MSALRPIGPHYGSTQQATLAAATPQAFTITKNDEQVRIWNSGANTLYFCTYESIGTVRVASNTDCFVPAGTITTITKPTDHDRISLISTAGTTVEFLTGTGW